MFDSIASTYDLLNRGTSLGVDTLWRAKMIRQLDPAAHKKILDVATGTADVALQTVKRAKVDHGIGLDLSEGVLKYGRNKVTAAGLNERNLRDQGYSQILA